MEEAGGKTEDREEVSLSEKSWLKISLGSTEGGVEGDKAVESSG